MRPAQVFISYRRDDTAGYARAVADELARRFGPERVFIDVDDIAAGQPFAQAIARSVARSSVLLVLIGRRWAGPAEAGAVGPARIHDPADFVHREVAAALARGLRVIPVLFDGAPMPAAASLPPPLRALAGRNALAIDGTRWAADVARLVQALAPALPAAPRRRWIAAALLLAAAGAGAWAWWTWRDAPADLGGRWQAEVNYPWGGGPHRERFDFEQEGESLSGSAGFLGLPRPFAGGRVQGRTLSFTTRMRELDGGELVHRYQGELAGDEIRFALRSEGPGRPPVETAFIARRDAP